MDTSEERTQERATARDLLDVLGEYNGALLRHIC
jgi:hypothetical protein